MKNKYEIRGDLTVIFLGGKKHGEFETIIDTEDLAKVQEFTGTWLPNKSTNSNNFYVQGHFMRNRKSQLVMLHRIVTGAPKGMVVDHINHNTLDNTKSNLRVVTNAENQQNRSGPTKANKTKIRGVYKHKIYNRWEAKLRLNGKLIYLGFFDNVHEAEKAVKEARVHYHKFA